MEAHRIWKCFFPYSYILVQRMLLGRQHSQNFYSRSWTLILSEFRSTLRKHPWAARKTICWGNRAKSETAQAVKLILIVRGGHVSSRSLWLGCLQPFEDIFLFPHWRIFGAYFSCLSKVTGQFSSEEVREQRSSPCGWLVCWELFVGDELCCAFEQQIYSTVF